MQRYNELRKYINQFVDGYTTHAEVWSQIARKTFLTVSDGFERNLTCPAGAVTITDFSELFVDPNLKRYFSELNRLFNSAYNIRRSYVKKSTMQKMIDYKSVIDDIYEMIDLIEQYDIQHSENPYNE